MTLEEYINALKAKLDEVTHDPDVRAYCELVDKNLDELLSKPWWKRHTRRNLKQIEHMKETSGSVSFFNWLNEQILECNSMMLSIEHYEVCGF